jgi:hypothetical protein
MGELLAGPFEGAYCTLLAYTIWLPLCFCETTLLTPPRMTICLCHHKLSLSPLTTSTESKSTATARAGLTKNKSHAMQAKAKRGKGETAIFFYRHRLTVIGIQASKHYLLMPRHPMPHSPCPRLALTNAHALAHLTQATTVRPRVHLILVLELAPSLRVLQPW